MANNSTNELVSHGALEEFLRTVPNLSHALQAPEESVVLFGYFLMERGGLRDITPKMVRGCFDAAVVATPSNISYTMKKSRAFIRTAQGTQLSRDAKARIENSLIVRHDEPRMQVKQPHNTPDVERTRNVVVVHGRDVGIRNSMFQFLTSLRLNPIEWNAAVARTGQGSPYMGQVVEALFTDAQAIVVIFSPDEHVELREDLRGSKSDADEGWQPRPNVFIEAGMALAKDEAHTILVNVGPGRPASDLFGRNLVNLDDSPPQRLTLAQRLLSAGCAAVIVGTDWLNAGKFKVSSKQLNFRRRKLK